MDRQKLFSIGQVAQLFHTSASSLRHYEQLGLLVPERIDPDTGYRAYSVRQFEVLNTIRYLRALDMPLAEIAGFLQDREVGLIEQKLRRQKEIVARKAQELRRIERKIDNRLAQLRDAQESVFDTVSLHRLPPCRIVRVKTALHIRDSLDLEAPLRDLEHSQAEALIFLGKVGVGISCEKLCAGQFEEYDRVFLVLDEEDQFEGPTLQMPETLCVRLRFCGVHTEAPRHYRTLMDFIRARGLEAAGFSREITMIDSGLTSDPQKFVTEICIPVREKNKT